MFQAFSLHMFRLLKSRGILVFPRARNEWRDWGTTILWCDGRIRGNLTGLWRPLSFRVINDIFEFLTVRLSYRAWIKNVPRDQRMTSTWAHKYCGIQINEKVRWRRWNELGGFWSGLQHALILAKSWNRKRRCQNDWKPELRSSLRVLESPEKLIDHFGVKGACRNARSEKNEPKK